MWHSYSFIYYVLGKSKFAYSNKQTRRDFCVSSLANVLEELADKTTYTQIGPLSLTIWED